MKEQTACWILPGRYHIKLPYITGTDFLIFPCLFFPHLTNGTGRNSESPNLDFQLKPDFSPRKPSRPSGFNTSNQKKTWSKKWVMQKFNICGCFLKWVLPNKHVFFRKKPHMYLLVVANSGSCWSVQVTQALGPMIHCSKSWDRGWFCQLWWSMLVESGWRMYPPWNEHNPCKKGLPERKNMFQPTCRFKECTSYMCTP